MMKHRLVAACSLALLFTSCNAFDWVDSPQGDEQILSEARACFDRNDIVCAKEMYLQLSTAKSDEAGSELAFALLSSAGVTMKTFLTAIPAGQGGKGVTKMAELIAPGSPAKRAIVFEAYKASLKIQSVPLRGLIRFLSAFSLIAEILAEQMGGDGKLYKNNLVRDSFTCIDNTKATAGACLLDPACDAPDGSTLAPGAAYDFLAADLSTIDMSVQYPTLGMIIGGMNAVNFAFVNELNAGGTFKTGTGGFVSSVASQDPVIQAPCVRYALISNDVGN